MEERDCWLPSSRLLPRLPSAEKKTAPAVSPVSGGSSWRGSPTSSTTSSLEGGPRVFYLVTRHGEYIRGPSGDFKAYRAAGPAAAAKKAFYAFFRSKAGKRQFEKFSSSEQGEAAREKHAVTDALTEAVTKSIAKRKLSPLEAKNLVSRFVRKCEDEDSAVLGFRVEVCILESEGKSPRKYVVGYKRNEAPNAHQAKKLITKQVEARFIPAKKKRTSGL